jgi:hypothetical protein
MALANARARADPFVRCFDAGSKIGIRHDVARQKTAGADDT